MMQRYDYSFKLRQKNVWLYQKLRLKSVLYAQKLRLKSIRFSPFSFQFTIIAVSG